MKPTKPGFWFCNTGERFEPVNVWEVGRVLFFENFPNSDGPIIEDELVDETDDDDWGPEIKMDNKYNAGKINVTEIIESYLKEHGYDGLYTDDCGCKIGDLAPCDSNPLDCKPGYKIKCEIDDFDCDWTIGPEKTGEDIDND